MDGIGQVYLQMQPVFFCQQFFDGLPIHFVGNATVDGANGRTLGFFMEPLALGAFVGNDVIGIDADGRVALAGVDGGYLPSIQGS